MLRDWYEKLKRIVTAGIGVKIALLLGGPVLVTVLHAIIWGLIAPAIDTIFYILSHWHQIATK